MFTKSVLLSGIFILQCVCGQDLIVNTTLGTVRGVLASDGDYVMYLGIPYGKVVDQNPFGMSIPHPEYDDIFEANDDSHLCPQISVTFFGSLGLDCLRLNVFTPTTIDPTNKLPVMIWIHGGKFEFGSYGRNMLGPKFLVRHDIIVVTINYRLGAFGFMCLDIPEVPGNQGLKDQRLALKWINDNIEAFGGDANKITLAGTSAGSMSVEYQLLRQNEGPKLIDKAILQSGTTFTPSSRTQAPVRDAPILIANQLGFSTNDIHESIAYLATIDPQVILEAVKALGLGGFIPCIEKVFEGVEPFLTEEPISMTVLPAIKDMPIIMGFNNNESLSTVINLGSRYSVHDALADMFNTEHADFDGMEDIVRHFFFGDEEANDDNVHMGSDLSSDISFIYPTMRSLERFLANDAEMYLYMFSYNGERNLVQERENMSMGGAWHGDELSYLFDVVHMDDPSPEDQVIVDVMTTMWANFMKFGNPTPEPSELLPEIWTPITKGSPHHYLNINRTMYAGTNPYNERMRFWDVFYDVNEHLQDLIVNTTLGTVRGVLASEGDYAMYLGIPYGKVVEQNPFGIAIPHPEYDDIFEANDDSHICPQISNTFSGSLDFDCLRLSVFTPTTASHANKLPVLVWIHGGRFAFGAYGRRMLGPKFLVRHDIIVVTINYRLGPFGFMCLDIPDVPGNQGLKDQRLALKWVNDNIEAFGGDANKITLGGTSAGSMSVEYQLLRQNEGPKLVDKAILQSGTTFTPSSRTQVPVRDAPILIANQLGFSTNDIHESIAYLATIDPQVILEAVKALGLGGFIPCIEKVFEGVEPFLTEEPISMTVLPAIKDMPIIMGFNNNESLSTVINLGSRYSVHDALADMFNTEHADFDGMEDIVRHFFFGDEEANDDNVHMGSDLSSDISFIYPTMRSLERFLANDAEMYLYMFSYNGERNLVQERENMSMGGAWHGDELSYLFDVVHMDDPSPEDQVIVDVMTTMWANFMKFGNPTPEPSELLPEIWTPITKGSPHHYLNINRTMYAGTNPYNERMRFWDVFYDVNEHLQVFLANNTSELIKGKIYFIIINIIISLWTINNN